MILARPCIIGDGIKVIDNEQFDALITLFDRAALNGRVMKFVPASGAASRMFHSLSYVYHHYEQIKDSLIAEKADHPDVAACHNFLSHIKKFSFYEPGVERYIINKQYIKVLEWVLTESGLNYDAMPKALVKFHKYPDHARTALEEHLVEALYYTKDVEGNARVHFTVSPEHREACNSSIQAVRTRYEKESWKLDIRFSEQKKSTDAVAVDLENIPVRDYDGKLVFRPAGHGALLENLNDLKADIIFLKNIDNVVPDHLKETTYLYKKLLGGYLIQLQTKVFHYLAEISQQTLKEKEINEAYIFANTELSISFPYNFGKLSATDRINILFDKLNRPIRVCGMVKNQGEPGGGPFWVTDKDGTLSLQIVEKAQIDLRSDGQKLILESSTHFNPVDLVCGVRDYSRKNFDLKIYSDQDTGFISIKSKNGKKIKAMELPGLWNGAMANWITVFVEVPLITFNPVKTVNDLLRSEHQ